MPFVSFIFSLRASLPSTTPPLQANPGRMVVVSFSLGAAFSQTVNNAVDALTHSGIPCVVAAGNSNIDASQASPASSTGAITVGASGKTDLRESKSLVGPLCVCMCMYLLSMILSFSGVGELQGRPKQCSSSYHLSVSLLNVCMAAEAFLHTTPSSPSSITTDLPLPPFPFSQPTATGARSSTSTRQAGGSTLPRLLAAVHTCI